MKIRKQQQNKLFKLKLIKAKIYKKSYLFPHLLKLEDIEYRLKKALQIIYKFHKSNKKIFFIGGSENPKINNLLKHTKHTYIPTFLWKNYTTNQSSSSLIKLIYISNIQKNNNLVVILDEKISNDVLIKNFKRKVFTICFENSLNIFNLKCVYKVPGSYTITKKKIKNHFFFSLLKSIFKKN